ncbi:MAG: 50S ribosomal protein L32 [Bacilli bacterium]|nr:50S ribosomal protein L32 [Bacilli bacterium]MDD5605632.1 50S ribosomal protein L32 [Dehalococcoidales bacterium]
MAVPARKISKTSKRMRRAHDFLTASSTTVCPNCKAVIKPHRVCDACGYYKGKKVTKDKEETTK